MQARLGQVRPDAVLIEVETIGKETQVWNVPDSSWKTRHCRHGQSGRSPNRIGVTVQARKVTTSPVLKSRSVARQVRQVTDGSDGMGEARQEQHGPERSCVTGSGAAGMDREDKDRNGTTGLCRRGGTRHNSARLASSGRRGQNRPALARFGQHGRQGVTRFAKARCGMSRTKHGRHGWTRFRNVQARRGIAGKAWSGEPWHVEARPCNAGVERRGLSRHGSVRTGRRGAAR